MILPRVSATATANSNHSKLEVSVLHVYLYCLVEKPLFAYLDNDLKGMSKSSSRIVSSSYQYSVDDAALLTSAGRGTSVTNPCSVIAVTCRMSTSIHENTPIPGFLKRDNFVQIAIPGMNSMYEWTYL